jgi:hypothetical protein
MNTLYVSVTSHTKATIDPFPRHKTAGTNRPLNSIYYRLLPASPPTAIHRMKPRYRKM